MKDLQFNDLSPEITTLVDAAEKGSEKAYSPHSQFKVGAALLISDGEIIVGANYECDSYGLTQCAERAAIHFAQIQGCAEKVTTIVVIGKGEEFNGDIVLTPCGACRQWIVELAKRCGRSIPVYCVNADKTKVKRFESDELLPGAFQF